MINNSFYRILLLLKRDWIINRKQHGFIALIFLIVIWFIEIVPLFFSDSLDDWKEQIISLEPSYTHFTLAAILYFFVFLSWVSRTLYRSRTQHFYLIPATLKEKYLTLLIQGLVMHGLAIVVTVVSLIPHFILFHSETGPALVDILTLSQGEMLTALERWRIILSLAFFSVLLICLFFFRIIVRNQVVATFGAISSFILVFLLLLPIIIRIPLGDHLGEDIYDNWTICAIISGVLLLVDVAICIIGYYVFKRKQIR